MLINIIEFFQTLPPKHCKVCGNEIEEQHECYGNICFTCIDIKDIK